ncbi:MAG: SUMF1/EgtB/PvdO family nonheme iron enzyme [Pirellulaceae bacterium]|nr:SUMF1/EgtB/PvdO family nonheme iron enzyme [Pirellulaceae bacterium]
MKPICFLLAFCFALPVFAQDTLPKGIVKEKPSEGFFVETDQGFMVPYTETIPGTDTKFEMIPIPAGTFHIGSAEDEEDRSDDEGPQICIEVAPFWMGKHEVTWGEYKRYMDLHDQFKAFQEQGLREITESNEIDAVTAPSTLYDPSFTYDAGDGENEPAATMTQYSAKQYTKWLSILTDDFYRLPGEAEWEYACRAGTKTRYYFGDDADELEEHAWYDDNSDYERHDVGQKKPNPWGLYDMYGNVSEWVLDQHDENGYPHLDPEKTYQAIEAINWPTQPDPYVARGGSWELYPEDLRSAARLASNNEDWKSDDPNTPKSPWWFTTEPSTGVGFRIVRPLAAPSNRKAKEEYWRARSRRDEMAVKFRLESDGKGAKGIVDRDLPEAIKNLESDR